jgi:nucleoside diphosphate kinase
MNERSLVFVKPRNEDIAQKVFDYLGELLVLDTECHLRSKINHLRSIPEATIAEHYRDLKKFDEELFRATMEVYKTGTIFLAAYSGTDIIPRIRTKIGNLDPLKSEPWTIRGMFSKDSLEVALRDKRYLNNVIHASSDSNEAARELGLWKDYLLD